MRLTQVTKSIEQIKTDNLQKDSQKSDSEDRITALSKQISD